MNDRNFTEISELDGVLAREIALEKLSPHGKIELLKKIVEEDKLSIYNDIEIKALLKNVSLGEIETFIENIKAKEVQKDKENKRSWNSDKIEILAVAIVALPEEQREDYFEELGKTPGVSAEIIKNIKKHVEKLLRENELSEETQKKQRETKLVLEDILNYLQEEIDYIIDYGTLRNRYLGEEPVPGDGKYGKFIYLFASLKPEEQKRVLESYIDKLNQSFSLRRILELINDDNIREELINKYGENFSEKEKNKIRSTMKNPENRKKLIDGTNEVDEETVHRVKATTGPNVEDMKWVLQEYNMRESVFFENIRKLVISNILRQDDFEIIKEMLPYLRRDEQEFLIKNLSQAYMKTSEELTQDEENGLSTKEKERIEKNDLINKIKTYQAKINKAKEGLTFQGNTKHINNQEKQQR